MFRMNSRQNVVAPPGDIPFRLSSSDWEALPIAARAGERLVDILILAADLRADLDCEEAAQLAWITPTIDGVLAETDALLHRLAS